MRNVLQHITIANMKSENFVLVAEAGKETVPSR